MRNKMAKSLDATDLEALVKAKTHSGKTDFGMYVFIANLLWVSMTEKDQKKVIATLTAKADK
jgi:hypothetical protein